MNAGFSRNGTAIQKSIRSTTIPAVCRLSETKRLLLNKYLGEQLRRAAQASITPRPAGEPAPLSLSQEQVWLRAQESAELPAFYNESITISRHGPINSPILARSLTAVLRQHEAWRTTFDLVDGQPIQVIHLPPTVVPLPVMDLQQLPSTNREAEALRIASEDAQQPFDLKEGPLMRARLISLSKNEHRLALTMHQSITDGVTVNTLFPTELITIYEALNESRTPILAELPIQFADYAWWQRQWIRGTAFATELAYWEEQLTPELPALRLPANFSQRVTYRGAIQPFTLEPELTRRLNALSREHSVTLFTSLLAGYSALLCRCTGQEDFIIGTLAPCGRKRSEVQNLMGYFLNPIPLRIVLSGDPTFTELLLRARETISEAIANDDVPLEFLEKKARASSPLFDIVISLAPALPDLPSGWDQSFMDAESGGSRWPLYFELSERPAGLLGRAQYNPDVFTAETITQMVAQWRDVLEVVVTRPELRLSDLPFYHI
jgi:Condensation domain